MERVLPNDVKPYAKSPVFTAETVPDNLTSDHSLKAGTWGLLTVEHGDVTYFTKGPDAPLPDDLPETNQSKSGRERAITLAKRDNLTVRQLAQRLGGYAGTSLLGIGYCARFVEPGSFGWSARTRCRAPRAACGPGPPP